MIKKEIVEKWEQRVETLKLKRNHPIFSLWLIAAEEIVEILKNKNMKNAVKELEKLRERYKEMAISSYYKEALNDLGINNETIEVDIEKN